MQVCQRFANGQNKLALHATLCPRTHVKQISTLPEQPLLLFGMQSCTVFYLCHEVVACVRRCRPSFVEVLDL